MALSEVLRLRGGNFSQFSLWLLLPFSWALAVKDRQQGKVRKTHRDVLLTQKTSNITVQLINSSLNNDD